MPKLTEQTDSEKFDASLESLRIRLKNDVKKYLQGIDTLISRSGGKTAAVALASNESKTDALTAIAAAKTLIDTISEDTDTDTELD